jgi:hypothetical protein
VGSAVAASPHPQTLYYRSYVLTREREREREYVRSVDTVRRSAPFGRQALFY